MEFPSRFLIIKDNQFMTTPFVNKKIWGFQEMLKIGNRGESLILNNWPELQKHTDSHHWDFDHEDGSRWEVKTDRMPFDKTANVFMERWSVFSKDGTELPGCEKKPGGPWQSLAHGVEGFLYLYLAEEGPSTLLLFPDLRELVDRLEYLLKEYPSLRIPSKIPNRGYEALGYRIPRYALDSLFVQTTLVEGKE